MSLVKFSTKYILKSSFFAEFAEFFYTHPKMALIKEPIFYEFPRNLHFPLVNRLFLVYD